MARKTILLDDFDGSELPDGTAPVRLSLGRTTYAIYLSEANHGKLMDALEPFITNAETTDSVRAVSPKSDKAKMKKVRDWAIENQVTFKDAQGEEKTLGTRGRIPQEVIDAYDKEH